MAADSELLTLDCDSPRADLPPLPRRLLTQNLERRKKQMNADLVGVLQAPGAGSDPTALEGATKRLQRYLTTSAAVQQLHALYDQVQLAPLQHAAMCVSAWPLLASPDKVAGALLEAEAQQQQARVQHVREVQGEGPAGGRSGEVRGGHGCQSRGDDMEA